METDISLLVLVIGVGSFVALPRLLRYGARNINVLMNHAIFTSLGNFIFTIVMGVYVSTLFSRKADYLGNILVTND
jgi:hypothetical protein